MMKTIKILSILLLLPTISFSQIQYGGAPIAAINFEEINFITIDHSNIINNNLHPMVLKYANEYSVDINVPQLATKIEGSYESTFYLGIESTGAMALAFIFDEFNLTENTKLFIYDENKSMHIGSFNSKNNNPSGTLSTAVVKSERVIIELTIPNFELIDLKLHLSIVTHDFLDLMNFHGDETSNRVDCNDNVACSSADDWGDQVDAVVLVSGGGGVCSAAIVNNTAFDLEPYILYAAHCNGGSSTVYFNFQSNTCSGNSAGNYNTMSGTQTLAVGSFNNNDYALIKLNNDIPSSYGAYYAGWNRSTSNPGNNVVGIHHADGEVKKISYDAYGMGSSGNWWDFAYSNGRVIPGSSGSPFFDSNKRIRGMASYIYTDYCSPSPDCYCSQSYYHGYAKFSSAWSNIDQYLDPINSNVYSIDGTRYGEQEIYGCTNSSACNYDPDATDDDGSCEYAQGSCNCSGNPTDNYCDCNYNVDDECGVCDGDGSSCAGSVILSFSSIDGSAGTAEIYMQNDVAIAGFQFVINDSPNYLDLIDVYGGTSSNYNFTVSSSENGTILGFTLTGTNIPEGSGDLLVATFENNNNDQTFDLCLSGPVFSDPNANGVSVTLGSCVEMDFFSSLPGDLNDDGLVNVLDVVVLVNIILGQAGQDPAGDLNDDGLINVLDVVILLNMILGG